LVANHFRGEAVAWAAGEELVLGVFGNEFRRCGRGLAIRRGEGDLAEDGFDRPFVIVLETEGEVVEEWEVGWRYA
jgi:hypothetical protein